MPQTLAGSEYPFAMLAHRWSGDLPMPNIQLVIQPAVDGVERVRVCERLLQSYLLAKEAEKETNLVREGEDLWTGILQSGFPALMTAIELQDPEKMSQELMAFGTEPVWFGGLHTGIDGYNSLNLDTRWIAVTYFDKLVSIAEYLGIITVEINESSEGNGKNLGLDVNTLVAQIENELGISINPPVGVTPIIGIATNGVAINYRHLLGLYGAMRLSDLAKERDAILEIGGGLGLTALYARRMGFKDYTLLDLPLSCLFAGHYLINSLGGSNVGLYGEKLSKSQIKILPYWEIKNLPSNAYGLSINQDGFPEMADNLIFEYLHQIKRITIGSFLSLNCERVNPRTVHNFVKTSGGFKKIYRAKSFIREGFVEEAYKILPLQKERSSAPMALERDTGT